MIKGQLKYAPDQSIGESKVLTGNHLCRVLSRRSMISARTGSRQFVALMIYPDTDALLRDWILADNSSAPATVALSTMSKMMNQYVMGEAAGIFEEIHLPVVTVNGDH